jgi:hypothetical protein
MRDVFHKRAYQKPVPEDISTFLVRALERQFTSIADIRSFVRRLRKHNPHTAYDAPTRDVTTWRDVPPRRAMIHYLNDRGHEVDFEGMATVPGNHEYFCALHRDVQLVDVTFSHDKPRYILRQHGGRDYYCAACESERRKSSFSL